MKTQINGRVYMLAIISSLKLMGFLKRNRIKRKRMVLTIKFMSKYLAIKGPAKSRRIVTNKANMTDRMRRLFMTIRLYISYQ